MNIAAAELVDIFFQEQFKMLNEDNAQKVINQKAHRELSIHTILLSSSRKEVRDEGMLHLVLMPADLQKKKEEQLDRMTDLLARNDGVSHLLAAGLARDMDDCAEESRLLLSARDRRSSMAGMQLGAQALEVDDIHSAMQYYQHAADLDNPIAQHKLGYLFEQAGARRDLPTAARWYLRAGKNGHPDALYNLSLLVESGQVACPDGWTTHSLTETAQILGCPSAKAAFVQTSIAVIDSLTAQQVEQLMTIAWETYVEAPEIANHSFFLGALYVPTAVTGTVSRHFDVAKAIHFLKIAKRLEPVESRDSLLQNILSACPVIPPETSPTIATLTQQAEKNILNFKIQQLKAVVRKWTEEPMSKQLMAYCNASMLGAGAGSAAPTNAVVFASLLSKSLDKDSDNDAKQNTTHNPSSVTPVTPASAISSTTMETETEMEQGSSSKGAPHLVDMSSEQILQLIASFHAKRVEWDFPTDPTDFPFRLPGTALNGGPFSVESTTLLTPVLVDLLTPEHLPTLAHMVSVMQPHGALIALYLLEIPFFARELNQWADNGEGFPLSAQCSLVASHSALTTACLEALCASQQVEIDVATACLHLLTKCREQQQQDASASASVSASGVTFSGVGVSGEEFQERLARAVLALLQREGEGGAGRSIAARAPLRVPLELLLSCIQLCGGFIYSKDLLASSAEVFAQMKSILQDATQCDSDKCHPEFSESFLSAEVMAACRRVVEEVIGVESTASSIALGRTELRSVFQQQQQLQDKSARTCPEEKKTCGLEGCPASSELKRCGRCGGVAYCTVEHQKQDWKKHKKKCIAKRGSEEVEK